MEKYFGINEVSAMTGLTTRTLRNYIKSGVLIGEKVEGIWRFAETDFEKFISNPNVKPSIRAKNNALVYDFLLDGKKKVNQICTIIDLYEKDGNPRDLSRWFCDYINHNKEEDIRFTFEKNGANVRIILKGREQFVIKMLNTYNKEAS